MKAPAGVGASGARDAPVINAMKVAPSQQVMLKVRFLEVDRTARPRSRGELVRREQERDRLFRVGSHIEFGDQQTLAATTRQRGQRTQHDLGRRSIGQAPSLSGVFPGAAAAAQPFGSLLAQVINTNGSQDRHLDFGAGGEGSGQDPGRARPHLAIRPKGTVLRGHPDPDPDRAAGLRGRHDADGDDALTILAA